MTDVEGEARKVRQWRAEVERQAEGLMTRGMATGNQTHLATGLQGYPRDSLRCPGRHDGGPAEEAQDACDSFLVVFIWDTILCPNLIC